MGDLSRNFSRHEFHCRCCGRAELNPRLVEALQELRDLAGRAVRITSGYRCPDHNRAEGGSKRSQHLLGNAADIVIGGHRPTEMFCLATVGRRFERYIDIVATGGDGDVSFAREAPQNLVAGDIGDGVDEGLVVALEQGHCEVLGIGHEGVSLGVVGVGFNVVGRAEVALHDERG